jgi:hypothetical protein
MSRFEFELLVAKPISTIQIDERPMLCVRMYVLPQQLHQGLANQSRD